MSRRFPLATVLRVRAIEEEVARGSLAQAVADEAEAAAAVARAGQAYDAAVAGSAVGPVAGFLADRTYRAALAADASAAGGRRAVAASGVDTARQAWSAAAMRLSALERLRDRAGEAQRLELLAVDQRTAEETAAAVLAGRSAR